MRSPYLIIPYVICEKAGVSVGSFYQHFKNKAGIIIELYSICDIYFSETILPTLLKKSNSYYNKIIDYIASQMQYGLDIGNDCSTQLYKAQITDGNEFFLSMERGLPNGLCYMRLPRYDIINIKFLIQKYNLKYSLKVR
ncbi:TetR/AcrR family transcriptional regulator [Clostridium sp. FP1]|uniref:TetR/AcrR family transcriptional regulator n=1 Tax=Clostridium sp. FP1 TaxID=2724076 RepID=UPI0013E93F66|nr:TetR/AcrR family transcriptional regulator [Clostridium sp. FP1]MBZ9634669.1 TetR/AcrR family transcriptional regulator [Clostridium sp. FP1]